MSCEIHLQDNMLYTVIIKEPILLFFTRVTKIYTNITKEEVQKLTVPWSKILRGNNVPFDVAPKRVIVQ